MNPFQYLFYKIYKTYRKIDKFIPYYWYGPRRRASINTSILLCSPFFMLSYKLNVWKDSSAMISQFVSGFILLSMTVGLSIYFDTNKISSIVNQKFGSESKIKSAFGSLLINILIIAYVGFIIKMFINGN